MPATKPLFYLHFEPMFSRIIICLLLLFAGIPGNGQSDTLMNSVSEQVAFLQKAFDSVFIPEKELINGRVYIPEGDTINHPYFGQNAWKQGEIYYNGKTCLSSHLRYDICSDHLINIFLTQEFSFPVILNREVVSGFSISTHHFRLLDDTVYVRKKILEPGYFEVLYEGNLCLYLRWMKSREIDRSTLQTLYPETLLFFIKKDGMMKNIRNLRELIEALGDHEKEIRAFIEKNHIQFRKKDFQYFDKVLEYYDSL